MTLDVAESWIGQLERNLTKARLDQSVAASFAIAIDRHLQPLLYYRLDAIMRIPP